MLQTMYCVERSDGPDQWVQEQCFKTEFKAFVNARAKSLAFTNVYRVIYQSPGLSGEVVRVAKGKALLNFSEVGLIHPRRSCDGSSWGIELELSRLVTLGSSLPLWPIAPPG